MEIRKRHSIPQAQNLIPIFSSSWSSLGTIWLIGLIIWSTQGSEFWAIYHKRQKEHRLSTTSASILDHHAQMKKNTCNRGFKHQENYHIFSKRNQFIKFTIFTEFYGLVSNCYEREHIVWINASSSYSCYKHFSVALWIISTFSMFILSKIFVVRGRRKGGIC